MSKSMAVVIVRRWVIPGLEPLLYKEKIGVAFNI